MAIDLGGLWGRHGYIQDAYSAVLQYVLTRTCSTWNNIMLVHSSMAWVEIFKLILSFLYIFRKIDWRNSLNRVPRNICFASVHGVVFLFLQQEAYCTYLFRQKANEACENSSRFWQCKCCLATPEIICPAWGLIFFYTGRTVLAQHRNLSLIVEMWRIWK